jgi:hypothetical protein
VDLHGAVPVDGMADSEPDMTWHLQTRLVLFDRHFAVVCRWSDHQCWSVVEYVDMKLISWC